MMNKTKTELLNDLYQECNNCNRCELCKSRTNIVFSSGNPETAQIVLIGEAPGENEDLQGKPFVGKAGSILNGFLEKIGINRERDIYVINTLKCRPPKNRKPKKSEKKECEQYLLKQVNIIKPKLIVLCGSTALESFSKEKITKIRGCEIEILGYKAIPILHPSSKRYNKNYDEMTFADLMKVKSYLDLK